MLLNMLEYYKMIKGMGINIIYSGPIWADGIEGIAETLRKRLEFDELPLSSSLSVFSVFLEQMNNMLMYSAEKECFGLFDNKHMEASTGVFVLGAHGKTYFLQSGNAIKCDSADQIKGRIDHLNTLGKAELRKFYKEQIKSDNSNPESKGAGLGLIEIARRASSPIEYEFIPLDSGLTFFCMSVVIG